MCIGCTVSPRKGGVPGGANCSAAGSIHTGSLQGSEQRARWRSCTGLASTVHTNIATRRALSTPASTSSAQLTQAAGSLASSTHNSAVFLPVSQGVKTQTCITQWPLIGTLRQAAKARNHHPQFSPSVGVGAGTLSKGKVDPLKLCQERSVQPSHPTLS